MLVEGAGATCARNRGFAILMAFDLTVGTEIGELVGAGAGGIPQG